MKVTNNKKPFQWFLLYFMAMSHSFNRLWIHAIWATKERTPLITSEAEPLIYNFLEKQFMELGCIVRIVNGMPDHVHCLFLLNSQKSIADVIKQIKGSSSHFVNQSDLLSQKFSWQTGYAAFSVSESIVASVTTYIKNQKVHHQKRSFASEYEEFLKLNGLLQEPTNEL